MQFSNQQKEEIEKLAVVGYTVEEFAMYFDIPVELLRSDFADQASEFRYHFDRGILKEKAKLDIARITAAENGNVTAIQILEKRINEIEQQKLKKQILGE